MMARLRTKPELTKAGSKTTAIVNAATAASSRTARRPEKPLRAEKQDRDEHEEDADLTQALAEPQPAQRFDHPDNEAARARAGKAPPAPQDDDREGEQHEAVAHLRVHVIGGQKKAGVGSQASEPDAEAHREQLLD